jgi:hypothetical protein
MKQNFCETIQNKRTDFEVFVTPTGVRKSIINNLLSVRYFKLKKIKNFRANVKNCMVAIITVVCISCTHEDLYVGDTTISAQNSNTVLSSIPFADEQLLNEIASNSANVSYSVARKLATVEMELGIKESMDWYGAKLSEKPVVIYDGKSNPRYYEFIVSDQQGKELGTVTAYAQKRADDIIAYVTSQAVLLLQGMIIYVIEIYRYFW